MSPRIILIDDLIRYHFTLYCYTLGFSLQTVLSMWAFNFKNRSSSYSISVKQLCIKLSLQNFCSKSDKYCLQSIYWIIKTIFSLESFSELIGFKRSKLCSIFHLNLPCNRTTFYYTRLQNIILPSLLNSGIRWNRSFKCISRF